MEDKMEIILSVSFVWILFLLWIPLFMMTNGSHYSTYRHEYLKRIIILRRIMRSLKTRRALTDLRKTG